MTDDRFSLHAAGYIGHEAPVPVIVSSGETRAVPTDKFLTMARFMRDQLVNGDPRAEVKIDVRASDYNPNGRVVYAEWTKPGVCAECGEPLGGTSYFRNYRADAGVHDSCVKRGARSGAAQEIVQLWDQGLLADDKRFDPDA